MNEFSPEQPQAARQFSSSCAESHPATLKSYAETSEAQREESGLSIEPTPAESRQSTLPTQATHCIASGESDAEAPAGLHTNKQAGSHDITSVQFHCAKEDMMVANYLLSNANYRVLMSATVGGHEAFAENNGF